MALLLCRSLSGDIDVSYLLDYVEDIYDDGGPLAPVSILNPNPMYLPLSLLDVLYLNQNVPLLISYYNIRTFLVL